MAASVGRVDLASGRRGAEPELASLTNPPLYPRRRRTAAGPGRLRSPFVPDDLGLGMLQITLLVAGMRATLARPATSARPRPGRRSRPAPATVERRDRARRGLLRLRPAEAPDRRPGPRRPRSIGAGDPQVDDPGIVGLFGTGTEIASWWVAMTALAILFRVAALVMLYEHAQVDLEVDPLYVHKPIDVASLASANVRAGIPDAEWERARQQREDDSGPRRCGPAPGSSVCPGSAT